MKLSNRNCIPIGQFLFAQGLGTTVRNVSSARSQMMRETSSGERPTLPTLSCPADQGKKKPSIRM